MALAPTTPRRSKGYFGSIASGLGSVLQGLGLTLRHLFSAGRRAGFVQMGFDTAKESETKEGLLTSDIRNPAYFGSPAGLATLSYPHQRMVVPAIGRYELDCEIDDCIVCDKCARVCPVACIDITTVKSATEIGKTSDGSSKRLYAAQFDIDMAKCCFCGLCTTVCPTDCLTMTDVYDQAAAKVLTFTVPFANMSPEEATQKQAEYDEAQKQKAAAKLAAAAAKLPPKEGPAAPPAS